MRRNNRNLKQSLEWSIKIGFQKHELVDLPLFMRMFLQ